VQEPFAQAHRAEGQADSLFHFAVTALDPFRAAAANVVNEDVLAAPMGVGRHSGKNRFSLLDAGKKTHRKAEHRARGAEKLATVAAVAHGAGGHGAETLDAQFGRLGTEMAQGVERARDGLGTQFAGVDQVLGQAGADAFLMQNVDALGARLRHDALDGITAEIEDGVSHGMGVFDETGRVLPSFDEGLKFADEGVDFLQVFAASPFGIDLEERNPFENVAQFFQFAA